MLRVEIRSVPPMVKLYCAGRIVLGVEAETLALYGRLAAE